MDKIKLWLESRQGKDILTVLIVILLGIGSFELGRLSKSGSSPGIRIEYPGNGAGQEGNVFSALDAATAAPQALASTKGKFFASSRGQKYYPVDCTAGKTIKMENRVWFDTREAAEAAGYELSGSCN